MTTKLAFKSQAGKIAVLQYYDSLLEQWPLPHEKLYVNTRYGNTFIIACGERSAPPLILLHGSGMNSVMWLGAAREYSRKYRVFAVDIPGEPGRSEETQLSLKSSAYADWLKDVFDALSISKANLIGISLGAWFAVKFSVCHPEKVDKLVLLSPSGIGPQKNSFLLTTILYMILGERGRRRLAYKVNGDQPIPEVMLKYQLLIGKNFNYRQERIPLFSDSELKRLTMFIALFVGEKDVMLHSVKTAKRLEHLLPHAKINVLPEAGHTLINLTERIVTFLET